MISISRQSQDRGYFLILTRSRPIPSGFLQGLISRYLAHGWLVVSFVDLLLNAITHPVVTVIKLFFDVRGSIVKWRLWLNQQGCPSGREMKDGTKYLGLYPARNQALCSFNDHLRLSFFELKHHQNFFIPTTTIASPRGGAWLTMPDPRRQIENTLN